MTSTSRSHLRLSGYKNKSNMLGLSPVNSQLDYKLITQKIDKGLE